MNACAHTTEDKCLNAHVHMDLQRAYHAIGAAVKTSSFGAQIDAWGSTAYIGREGRCIRKCVTNDYQPVLVIRRDRVHHVRMYVRTTFHFVWDYMVCSWNREQARVGVSTQKIPLLCSKELLHTQTNRTRSSASKNTRQTRRQNMKKIQTASGKKNKCKHTHTCSHTP